MANLLQLKDGAKSYGLKTLFQNATFSINEGEHVGVIGPNGAGKSTLFRVLIDGEQLDVGEVVKANSLRLGYLAQEDHWGENETVEDHLAKCEMTPLWELKALARRFGLLPEHFSAPVRSLSGGYRMRVKLLYLLGCKPNLMLLDEPTNYLDLETLLVLEDFLLGFDGAFLLISHDREFLRRTTDHILEVESGEITKYNGNIDDYFEQKALLREQLEKRALSLEAKRKEVLDFATRFGAKATKARQVQSRLKSLDRMESIEIKALPVRARIRLPEPVQTGRQVLTMRDVALGYGEKVVLKKINFDFLRGDHVGVVGVNGAGKSTLLKGLCGELEALSGDVKRGHQVDVAYFAQHVSERLEPEDTVFEAMERGAHREVTRQEILDLAGCLLFSGDDVQKKVKVLSGGEKSRVALGQVLLKKAPCLLLDEPTNHLDFYTVESITQAVAEYPGTVVIVSHDRGFVGRVATKILEIRMGEALFYPGTYDEYVWSVQKGAMAELHAAQTAGTVSDRGVNRAGGERGGARATAIGQAAEAGGVQAAGAAGLGTSGSLSGNLNYKEHKKTLEKNLRQAEKSIFDLEKRMDTVRGEMDDLNEKLPNLIGLEAAAAAKSLAELQAAVDAAESEWLDWAEKRETWMLQLQQLVEGT